MKKKKLTKKDVRYIMQITKDLVRTDLKSGYIRMDNIKKELLETLEYVIDNYHVCEE